MPRKDINKPSFLLKEKFEIYPDQIPKMRLKLKFESVQTEELKNVEITFEGNRGIFKVGDGELNHY